MSNNISSQPELKLGFDEYLHNVNPELLLTILKAECNANRVDENRHAAQTLLNLCSLKTLTGKVAQFVKYLPIMGRLLDKSDIDVLVQTCTALSKLSHRGTAQKQAVIRAGVCRRLVELLMHPEPKVKGKALLAVANIVAGTESQVQSVLDLNPLPGITQLLYSSDAKIKKSAILAVSNIACGNEDQIQAIISANILQRLMNIMETAGFETRKDIGLVINNLIMGATPMQVHYAVMIGCLPELCDFLALDDFDVVKRSLTSLEIILKTGERFQVQPNPYAINIDECGGLQNIGNLQSSENFWLSTTSTKIVDKYFDYEDLD
ncbi:hypothetical protein ACLKA6_002681 [Drosophila palustris]